MTSLNPNAAVFRPSKSIPFVSCIQLNVSDPASKPPKNVGIATPSNARPPTPFMAVIARPPNPAIPAKPSFPRPPPPPLPPATAGLAEVFAAAARADACSSAWDCARFLLLSAALSSLVCKLKVSVNSLV